MPLTTSPESPVPVRQVVSLIGGWVDRLGAVWVEGQVIGFNRPASSGTDFIRLRDKLAEVSIDLTAPRAVVDSLPSPLVNGAHIVVHARPTIYPGRGSLSLQVREIRLVGEGELLARLERRRQLLAAEGLFALELKRPAPFLAPTRRAGHGQGVRGREGRCSRTPVSAGQGSTSSSSTPPCRGRAARPR